MVTQIQKLDWMTPGPRELVSSLDQGLSPSSPNAAINALCQTCSSIAANPTLTAKLSVCR